MKNTFKIGAIALCFLTMTACQNGGKEGANNTQAQADVKLEKMKISAADLESDKKVGNDILTKDINLVFVWQPTCPPCEGEAAAIEKIYKEYKDINFIGIGVAEKEEDVAKTVKEWGLTYKNYFVKVDEIGKISKNITSTPTMLVLDKKGNEIKTKVVGSAAYGDDVDKMAEKLKEEIKAIQDEQK